jgi:hypothetical protein
LGGDWRPARKAGFLGFNYPFTKLPIEMSFRFNNRKNPFLFRDTLLKMIEAENVEYKDLTAKAA